MVQTASQVSLVFHNLGIDILIGSGTSYWPGGSPSAVVVS